MPTFDSQVKFQKIPVVELVVQQAASPGPTSPIVGQLWWDTTAGQLKVCTNATGPVWTQCDNVTGGTASNVADGDKGDITIASGVWTIDNGVVTLAKMAADSVDSTKIVNLTIVDGDIAPTAAIAISKLGNLNNASLLGNNSGSAATPGPITLGGDLEFSVNSLRVQAFTGDVTKAAGNNNTAIATGAILLGKCSASIIENGVGGGTAATTAVALRRLGFLADDSMPGGATLNQIAVPTAPVSMAGFNLTNLPDTPSAGTSAANKNYVDSVAQGLDAKQSVKFATTANIGTPTSAAPSTLDGQSVNVGDRILVKDQTTAADNGIYDVVTVGTGANGVWARSSDMNVWSEVVSAFTWVEAGTVNQDTGWVSTGNQSGTIGTTPMPWTQFSGAGQITDGIGLLKTGNTLDVRLDGTTIEAPADILQVKDLGITSAKLADASISLQGTKVTNTLPITKGGTGATDTVNAKLNLLAAGMWSGASPSMPTPGTWYTVSHGLGQRPRNVFFEEVSSGEGRVLDWRITTANPTTQVDIRHDVTGGRAASYYNMAVVAQ